MKVARVFDRLGVCRLLGYRTIDFGFWSWFFLRGWHVLKVILAFTLGSVVLLSPRIYCSFFKLGPWAQIVFLYRPNRSLNTFKTNWGFKLLVVRNMAALAGSAMLAQRIHKNIRKLGFIVHMAFTWRLGDPSSWRWLTMIQTLKNQGRGAKSGELREFPCVARIYGDNRRIARIAENCTILEQLQEFLQSWLCWYIYIL